MFFDGWDGLLHVVVVGGPTYVALILLLRGSGKRTLAKLNAFDFIVTIALGSVLAAVLLSTSIALVEGIAALLLLVGLQYGVAWASTRSDRVQALVRAEPTLLYRAEMLHRALRSERVTTAEVRQAARASGHVDMSTVSAVVLEGDGTLSVIGDGVPDLDAG